MLKRLADLFIYIAKRQVIDRQNQIIYAGNTLVADAVYNLRVSVGWLPHNNWLKMGVGLWSWLQNENGQRIADIGFRWYAADEWTVRITHCARETPDYVPFSEVLSIEPDNVEIELVNCTIASLEGYLAQC